MYRNLIEIGDYEINTDIELGAGNFGSVYEGKDTTTKHKVAAKHIPLIFRPDLREYAFNEVAILKLGKGHENIIQILHDSLNQHEVWIVTEFCDLGNLADYTGEYPLNLLQKLDIVHQASNALIYLLHLKTYHVVHRNIKPANILIKSKEGGIIVRVSDVGVSKSVCNLSQTFMVLKSGTEHYKAPELFKPQVKSCDKSVDVFALGVLLLHLIRAKEKQRIDEDEVLGDSMGIGETMYQLLRDRKEIWKPVGLSLKDSDDIVLIKRLIGSMIKINPKDRISMKKVHKEIGRLKASFLKQTTTSCSDGMEEYFSQAASLSVDPPHRQPPWTITATPSHSKLLTLQLPYKGSMFIAFSPGFIIVEDERDKELVKYSLADQKIEDVWRKRLPQGVSSDECVRYLTHSTLACMNIGGTMTRIFNQALQPLHVHKCKSMLLCGTLPHDRLVYAQLVGKAESRSDDSVGNSDDDTDRNNEDTNTECDKEDTFGDNSRCRLDLYQLPDHTHVGTLVRPTGLFAPFSSITCNPSTQSLAVIDAVSETLDLFNSFCHTKHVDLPFRPRRINAVATIQNWILIINGDDCCLNVYNWSGEELCVISNDDLALGGDYIYGIGLAGENAVILAAGRGNVESLHLYEFQ